nr:hypothetical protein [Tanacetum cinerariifolium]
MRPFGYHVTILNTLDPLENKPNVVGSGPTWLFDIDTFTKSVNYQPVSVGIQELFDAYKAGEGNVQQYVLFPLRSSGSKDRQNTDDATFEVKEPEFEVKKPESKVHVSLSSSVKTKKHDEKTKREAKCKNPVELSTGFRNLSEEFEEFTDNSINEVNAASTPVPAVGQITTNSTNTFSADGPSNTVVSPTLEESLYVDLSQYPDDPNMPDLEDITYSDDEEDVEEPKRVHQALKDPSWIEAIQEELLQFKMQKVWVLVDLPNGKRAIGIQIKQKPNGIFISQDKYVAEILRKFGLTDGKSASTPVDTEKPLLKDPDDVDVHTYRSMIGSLMYLTSSRPDIMFAVYACARFQVTPKASYLHTVKRIFRYLKGKPYLGLWYHKDLPFNLVAYSDSDYAGASLDRKSTTGGCQFLGCRLISWKYKKQTVVATSSTKAEYVAAASCCAQVLWIQNQLLDYGYNFMHTTIYIDNSSTIKKVIITEDTVRQALRLDDAESIDCLPSEEIFTELTRMGYEKPSTKLTFYKAFFLAQWKFLIHTILQCMSAKRTTWNEFSSSMASAVIYLTIGKGFFEVETQLFEGMLVPQQAADDVANVAADDVDDEDAAKPTSPLPTPAITPPPPPELLSTSQILLWMIKRMHPNRGLIADLDADKDVTLEEVDAAKDAEVEKNAELLLPSSEVVTAAATIITTAVTPITAATITAAPSAAKRRQRAVIRDPKETSTPSIIVHSETKAKDKGKGILVEEPKPLKKQAHIEQDEAYARELEAELNKNINWDDVIKHVKEKGKQDNAVLRYQALKRKLQTEPQARKNMMVHLKIMVGFKIDYFKGMSYDAIRLIFEKYFNSDAAFLEKSKEKLEEEASRALKRTSESSKKKAAKKQKLDE